MLTTFVDSVDEAVAGIPDGATVLIGGFGTAGQPIELIEALVRAGTRELTVVANNAGNGNEGLATLIGNGQVRRILCSFPRQNASWHFDRAYREGRVELEVVPQGTLAERIRAGGSGIGGFFTPTGYGTPLAEGKETRVIDGRGYVFERPIVGDVALIKAFRADRIGNLVYRKTSRNFGPVMAMASKRTIAQVTEIVDVGQLDPEVIVTPSIFTHTIVRVPAPALPREWTSEDAG